MFEKTIATEIKTKIMIIYSVVLSFPRYTCMKTSGEKKKKIHTTLSFLFFDLLLLYAKTNHLTVVISIWLQTHSVKRIHHQTPILRQFTTHGVPFRDLSTAIHTRIQSKLYRLSTTLWVNTMSFISRHIQQLRVMQGFWIEICWLACQNVRKIIQHLRLLCLCHCFALFALIIVNVEGVFWIFIDAHHVRCLIFYFSVHELVDRKNWNERHIFLAHRFYDLIGVSIWKWIGYTEVLEIRYFWSEKMMQRKYW